MFLSKVKAKLTRREPVLIFCAHLTDPAIHELIGLMGFDGIWMDMEHHCYSLEKAQDLMRAARIGSGADIMVRPANGEFTRLMRMLEAGAHGILYPRCSSAKDADDVVRAMKFHPRGYRGCDGGNRDMPFCTMPLDEYIRTANEQTFLFCQIETPAAVENAEEIIAVDGVDGLFFGPGDFSVESGVPGNTTHPKVRDAIKRVGRAAEKAGKHWGMPAGSTERAQELMDMGATLICHGADIIFIKTGLERMQEQFGKLGFTFDNSLEKSRSYLEQA